LKFKLHLVTKHLKLFVFIYFLKMLKPKKNNNPSKKRDGDNDNAAHPKPCKFESKPTLYSSVIQTELKLRNISLSRLEPKTNSIKV